MILYSDLNCVLCKQAKKLLENLPYDYKIIDVEEADGLVSYSITIDTYNGNSFNLPGLLHKEKLYQGNQVIEYLKGVRNV